MVSSKICLYLILLFAFFCLAVLGSDANLNLFYAQYAYFSTSAIGEVQVQYSFATNTITLSNNTILYTGASDPNFGATGIVLNPNNGNLLIAGGGTAEAPGYVFNLLETGLPAVPYSVSPDTTPGLADPRAYSLTVIPPNIAGFPVNYLIATQKEFGYNYIALLPLLPTLGSGIAYPVSGDDVSVTGVAFDANGNAYYGSGTSSSDAGNFGTLTFDGSQFTTHRLFGQPVGADPRGGLVYGGNHGVAFDPLTGDILTAGGDGVGQYDPVTHIFHWITLSGTTEGYQFSAPVTDGQGHIFLAACCGDTGFNGDGAGDLVIVDYSTAPGYLIDAAAGVHYSSVFLATNLGGVATSIVPSTPGTPVIFMQPQPESAIVGQTATFTVTASGVNLTYLWESEAPGATSFTQIFGATSTTYTTGVVSAADAGTQFLCIVTSAQGSVTSNAASLTVLPPSTNFVTSTNLGTIRSNYSGWVGMSVAVGQFPLSVTALGRIAVAGNTSSHMMKIVNATTLQDVAGTSTTVASSGGSPGTFVYANLLAPVTLQANTTYYIVSLETSGADSWYDWNTTEQSTNVGTIAAAVYGTPYITAGSVGNTFGPLDFKYASFVGVSVTPTAVTLTDAATQLFTATVTGTSNGTVAWSLNPTIGSIGSGGQYLAPTPVGTTQVVTVTATSNADTEAFATATITLQPSAKVQFVQADTSTQGNWKSAYGSDGYTVVGDSSLAPSYGTATPAGQFQWTWASSTSDVRALQRASAPGRIAAGWYGASFTVDVNETDGQSHQVAMYFVDWDVEGRVENVSIVDANSGKLLDSRSVSSFGNGTYLVWNVTGHVTIKIAQGAGSNAVVSGIFFGAVTAPPPPSATVAFVKTDSTSEGNWESSYGADGYNVLGDASSYPSYATVTPSGQTLYVWAPSSSDPRALQNAGASGRVAAAWYSGTSLTLNVNVTGGTPRQLALYFLDWEASGRIETVNVFDVQTGTLLDNRTVSNFSNGQYLVWNITGNVNVQISYTAGPNVVLSGIFFGAGSSSSTPPPSAVVSFVQTDGTSQGNWQSNYGADGYNVLGDASSYPSYATVTPSGQTLYVWAPSSTDPRALQNAGGSGRVAAAWYSPTSFTLNVNVSGGTAHPMALYFLDWEAAGRIETVNIYDVSSGTLLDNRTVSNFSSGQYLVWNITGNVTVQISSTAGPNAVLSGIFFGGGTGSSGPPPAATAQFTASDTSTMGNWKGVYGTNGFNVIGDVTQYPAFATVTPSGQSSWTWASSTSDVRALQKSESTTDRIAATWYSGSSFTVDINLTDTNSHQIAIYMLDWDATGRSQRVDILNASNSQVLDTRTVSNFSNGEYLVFTATGHVQLLFTNLASPNAVLSGLFF
jgi:VCBS repeat-containing protein